MTPLPQSGYVQTDLLTRKRAKRILGVRKPQKLYVLHRLKMFAHGR